MKNAYFFSIQRGVHEDRVDPHHRADINLLGVIANEAAYRDGADWFDQLLPYIDANHNYVVELHPGDKMPLVSTIRKPKAPISRGSTSASSLDKIDAHG